MNQFKRAQVIMLSTDKVGNLGAKNWYLPKTNTLIINNLVSNLYIISDDEIKRNDWILFSYYRKDGMLFKFIEKNEFGLTKVYNPITKKEEWYGDMFVYKKIIATTNTSLKTWDSTCFSGKEIYIKLPQPSQQFITKYIEEYNKGNAITDVLVEYENQFDGKEYVDDQDAYGYDKFKQILKINPKDNTITIKKLKDSWNREEIVYLMKNSFQKGIESQYNNWDENDFNLDNWIKDNL